MRHMYNPPRIAIVNHTGSGASDTDLLKMAEPLQRQVTEHFAPYYNASCALVVTPTPSPTDWVIGLFKDADQPGALGYHDITPNGLPLAKVFPLLDAQDGGSLSVTISHELLEMLADPYLSKAVQDATGKFWAYEICDAVESDEYDIDGVKVSSFVTPHYFEPPAILAGVVLDYMHLIKKPYEVRPGGYGQWHSGSGGWHQVEHASQARRSYRSTQGQHDTRHKRRERLHSQAQP